MSILSELPELLCLDTVSCWFGIKELTYLDTSLCNKTEREFFLHLYSDPYFTINPGLCLEYCGSLEWIILRNIKLTRLTVNCSVFKWSSFSIKFSLYDWSKITVIELKCGNMSKTKLTELVNACHSLLDLRIHCDHCYRDNLFERMYKPTLSQLKKLQLRECGYSITGALLKSISTYCHSLTELRFRFSFIQVLDEDILRLLQNNPHLQVLSLQCQSTMKITTFQQIPQLCPLITEIFITSIEKLVFESIYKCLKDAKLLKILAVAECANITVNSFFAYVRSTQPSNVKTILFRSVELRDFMYIISHIRNVQSMSVEMMPNVLTVDVLTYAAKVNPLLLEFKVEGCELTLTQNEIYEIMKPYCRLLIEQHVDIK